MLNMITTVYCVYGRVLSVSGVINPPFVLRGGGGSWRDLRPTSNCLSPHTTWYHSYVISLQAHSLKIMMVLNRMA